jgi:hypothetical protein
VTEKLGRHKLLLKKRKSQPGRSSAESSGSQEVENITSGEGSVVSSATGGSNGKLQSIRMRGGLSSEAGVKRLERLPVVSRSPSGLTSAPGRIPSGLNRFAELLKNRKGGDSGSRESGESKERKTDVGNLFETPRRPVPGNSGLDLIVSNYMYCIYWQGTLSPHMETRRHTVCHIRYIYLVRAIKLCNKRDSFRPEALVIWIFHIFSISDLFLLVHIEINQCKKLILVSTETIKQKVPRGINIVLIISARNITSDPCLKM